MKTMNISEVRSHLPALVEEIAKTHEELVVTRYGAPMVAIVPLDVHASEKPAYPLRGHTISVADDFDEPMPELWSALPAVAETQSQYSTGKRSASNNTKKG